MSNQKMIVLCLVGLVCLAGVALGAPASERTMCPKFMHFVCDTCQAVVEQAQTHLPELRPKLDQLCSYCGSPDATRKCLDKIHELEDKIENESPKGFCMNIGLCHAGPNENFVDAMSKN